MTEWTIERLGHKGDGIARGPVFVPRTLPGEVVSGVRDGDKLSAPRIVTPSAQRVSAPCRHYKSCGGCALQHADDGFVAEWKAGVVRAALAAHGLDAPFRPILTSPPASRRRAAFSGRRTKKGALVGFHAPASDIVTPVPDCHLVTLALRTALPLCERLVVTGGSRKGEMTLIVTESETGLDIAVSGGKPLDVTLQQELAEVIRDVGVARLTWEGDPILQETPPIIRFDGLPVPVPPGAFLQATVSGEAALRDSVIEAVGDAKHVIDLFAGCGTFALPLARKAEVHAVEGEAALTEALLAGWRGAGGTLKAVTGATRDLFRNPLLPDELAKTDAVVIDPPRAGAEAQTRTLAEAQVPIIVAVSCNPVTFARDAAVLIAAGYRLDWVQVVDQFRWSPHVELAARLSLPHMASK